LWVGTWENGLDKLDLKTGKFTNYNTIKNTTLHEGITINSLWQDKNGNLLKSTWSNGLCVFNKKSNSIEKLSLLPKNKELIDNTAVITTLVDKDGLYWITTFYNGLIVFDPTSNTFTNFRNENINAYIKSNITWGLFEDRNGIKWIGTYVGGLVKVVKNNSDFLNAKNIAIEKGGKFETNSNITSIYENQGS
jgi:ligand-binding sensor domain-containing protein